MEYKIIHEKECWAVVIDGEVFARCDTHQEAKDELDEIKKEKGWE